MMRHPDHHHINPNRMALHRMPAPQTRGQPIMVGMQTSPAPVSELGNKVQLVIFLVLFMFTWPTYGSLTNDEIRKLFDGKGCIEGVIVSIPTGPALMSTAPIPQQPPLKTTQQQQGVSENEGVQSTTSSQPVTNENNMTSTLANIKEKTPMCLINELARYNKIQHQYRLTSEQGPAHNKRFTVTLKLGNEEYEAEGAGIKKAQHLAAAEALSKTQYKHPPQKSTRTMRPGGKHGPAGMLTPTVELNALAMKRGERTMYMLESVHPAPFMPQPQPAFGYHRNGIYGSPQTQPRYGYDSRRNHTGRYGGGGGPTAGPSGNQPPHYTYNQYKAAHMAFPHHAGPAAPELFSVLLRVGPREYTGEGHTVQAARHNAAAKALHELKQLPTPADRDTHFGGDETVTCPANTAPVTANGLNGLTDVDNEHKSPISLVHEIALKRNLNVVFEVVSEKGPPHMKMFVTECRVGDIIAEGEGNGKKISKKRAAEKMLEELAKLPPLPFANEMARLRLRKKREVTKKKIRNLIKVNQEQTGNDYTEDINPISRLIQIQQMEKEKEPTYTVVEERGAPRRREFVIEAAVNGISCTGTGPNKKLAKRAAAEALLERLGYSKTGSTQPVKPSIKTEPKESNGADTQDKQRKVKFRDDKTDVSVPVGGTGGRQLVPGVIFMADQSVKMNMNLQPSSTIAKELLKAGTSPGADTLATKTAATAATKSSPAAAGSATNAATGTGGSSTTVTSSTGTTKGTTTQQGVRSKDQLLYLAQLLGVQVQFSDFPKANHEMFLTLVSLSTTPPQVCHGEGPTTEDSHEKAALEALTVLSELGLDNVIPKKEQPSNDSSRTHIKNVNFMAKREFCIVFMINMSLVYRNIIAFFDKFVPPKLQPLWNHPAGPKTVFFWSPLVKWGLVIAGISDLKRPADQLSISQSSSLAATGFIWARYSLVIIPKNYGLFSVNLFVGGTQLFQVFRVYRYQQSLKKDEGK